MAIVVLARVFKENSVARRMTAMQRRTFAFNKDVKWQQLSVKTGL